MQQLFNFVTGQLPCCWQLAKLACSMKQTALQRCQHEFCYCITAELICCWQLKEPADVGLLMRKQLRQHDLKGWHCDVLLHN